MENTIWIILGAVLGFLVSSLVVTMGLFCYKRSQRKIRVFSLRAVTPLDDAEFESWRRPSQYAQRPEKYGINPTQPAVVRTTRTPMLFDDKELGYYHRPQRRSISPTSPINKPDRVRRKSSTTSSIADRPPTPYSPCSPSGHFPRRASLASRTSAPMPYSHYPSMSQASQFSDFNFNIDPDSPPRDPIRPSTQSERPLHLSYGSYDDNV
ncbi:hypothetical protein K504DRAFT_470853 [Pleomassaria siparia CBS 279.74]|uniref:Uncharacterized protein n=1 Tax=Pleomassaria siparia CBS 279.74 TaxID=1314801 RepID=A0A6G1K1U0_9PLEO|nr:hypothetical protein K504DRAFT_470853 [Pleomassaria siparia CBS 279.74]